MILENLKVLFSFVFKLLTITFSYYPSLNFYAGYHFGCLVIYSYLTKDISIHTSFKLVSFKFVHNLLEHVKNGVAGVLVKNFM